MDIEHLRLLRANVSEFISRIAVVHDREGIEVLDVAPQDHNDVEAAFQHATVRTLDIDPVAKADYTGDITADNSEIIPDGTFDIVICAEVLEHTLAPWNASREIARMLRSGGHLYLTVPFNLRIHGPLPDCWRFTEHGLRALLSESFEILELASLETPDRFLMPIHYTVIARKRS